MAKKTLYNWDNAPEWAMYAAIDKGNNKIEGCWYRVEPDKPWNKFWQVNGEKYIRINLEDILDKAVKCKNSLEKRPNNIIKKVDKFKSNYTCDFSTDSTKNEIEISSVSCKLLSKEASLELIEDEGKISYIKSYPYIQCNIILKLGSKVFFACGKTRKDITDEWNENTDRVKGRAVQAMLFALQNKRIPRKLVWCEYWEKK